jgi:hypothetical protein
MPILFNKTPFPAELLPLIDARGRNVATIACKATYCLRTNGLDPASRPTALYMGDEYEDTKRGRFMRLASDLVDYKAATDVIVARPPGAVLPAALEGQRITIELGELRFSGIAADPWPFGPVPRDAPARRRYAGTYDAEWVAERMPLVPADFDYRFNQAAPDTQVTPFLRGDEILRIRGFEQGEVVTRLPGRLVLVAANASGRYLTLPAALDTVVLHPMPPRLELVWRLSIATKRSIEEVRYVWVYYPMLRSYMIVYGRDPRADRGSASAAN